jgi:PAS domain S-box-containing protein
MAKKTIPDGGTALRADAEARLALDSPGPPASVPASSALLHELRVHQIELEMQNEELRRSQLELEEAHNQLMDLYDFAPVGFVTLDGDGVITSANLTAASLLGVERGSLLRRRFPGFAAGVDGDLWHRAFRALLQGDERAARRLTLTRGDGVTFDADVVCERRSGQDGNRVRIVLTDVTEVARIERESHETKERLSLVIDSTGSGYTDWDIPSGRVKYSKRFASMLGYDLGELEPTVATWERLVHPDDRQRAWDSAQRHLRGETAQHECEERLQHKDGRWLWTMLRAKVVARDAGGAPLRFVGTHTDITDRKRAEEALSTSEAKFRELFHAVPALLWTIGPDGAVTDCNRGWCEFTGMTREQSLGTGWMEALHPGDRATSAAAWADALARGSLYQVEQRLRRHDGEYRWFLTRGTPIRDSNGEVVRWQGANVDISERKMAEDALNQSEERQRSIVTAMVEGVVLQDASGKVVQCNTSAERMLGLSRDQMEGRTSMDPRWRSIHEDGSPFPGEDHPAMVTLRTGAAVTGVIMGVHRPDGMLTWISINAEPLRRSETDPPYAVVATFADITKPRALQAQIALASRLAAMGTLVTGVAHEINNPLAAELADQGVALEIVREVRARLDDSNPLDRKAEVKLLDNVVEALEDAQGSGQRIARIVKDLTMFGRPGSKRERVQMVDIVNGALRWLPNAIGRAASIQVENGGAPDVVAASGQIEQVLLNLLTNAARAAPEGKRDTVIVRIGPGGSGMARLEVIDHGAGIEPAILGRVFEPFFTTHQTGVGKGMGLGLAISYAIVKAHGGTITVESEVGKGSTFRVELPAAPAET